MKPLSVTPVTIIVLEQVDTLVVGILMPVPDQFIQLLRILPGKVVPFERIAGDVKQLPFAISSGRSEKQPFPLILDQRPIAVEFPADSLAFVN